MRGEIKISTGIGMALWYYEKDNASNGPVDEDTFARLLTSGEITGGSRVWRSGMEQWMYLQDLPPEETGYKEPIPRKAENAGMDSSANPLRMRRKLQSDEGASRVAQSQADRSFLQSSAGTGGSRIQYAGTGRDLLGIYLKNIVLTLLTLGIYKFWAQVNTRKYHYQHLSVRGGFLDYHATGLERLIGFLKGMLLLSILAAPFVWWVFIGSDLPLEYALHMVFPYFALFLFLLRPLIVVGMMAFQLSRSSWNQMRFRFKGKIRSLYGMYLKDILLIILTLGIYFFWHQTNLMRFRRENSTLGGGAFQYSGTGGDLLKIWFKGQILTMLTLGIYAPWQMVAIHNYHIDNTRFQGMRFCSNLTGGQALGTLLVCLLQTVFTLGLGMPWAVARWKKCLMESVTTHGALDTSQLRGEYDRKAGAFAEGLGEAGEALEALGDFFGG